MDCTVLRHAVKKSEQPVMMQTGVSDEHTQERQYTKKRVSALKHGKSWYLPDWETYVTNLLGLNQILGKEYGGRVGCISPRLGNGHRRKREDGELATSAQRRQQQDEIV